MIALVCVVLRKTAFVCKLTDVYKVRLQMKCDCLDGSSLDYFGFQLYNNSDMLDTRHFNCFGLMAAKNIFQNLELLKYFSSQKFKNRSKTVGVSV